MMNVRAMYLFLTNPSLYGLCSVAATWRAEVRDVSGIGMTISEVETYYDVIRLWDWVDEKGNTEGEEEKDQ